MSTLQEAKVKEKETWDAWESALSDYKKAEKKARELLPEDQQNLSAEDAWKYAFKMIERDWSTHQDQVLWEAWESAKHARFVEQKANSKRQEAWSYVKAMQTEQE